MGQTTFVPGAPGALIEAYARTRLEFRDPGTGRDRVLHPGPPGRAGAWPFPGATAAAVVTAWHPRSEPGRPPDRNHADQGALRLEVARAGLRVVDCVGVGAATGASDAGGTDVASRAPWFEPSLLVPGVDRERACAWAARFEQNAIFWWTPSEWRIVGVLLAIPDVVLGWSLSDPG